MGWGGGGQFSNYSSIVVCRWVNPVSGARNYAPYIGVQLNITGVCVAGRVRS